MLRLFRLQKGGPPSPGLVAVRVYVHPTAHKRGHVTTIWKRPDDIHKPTINLHGDEGLPEPSAVGGSYEALVYVSPEDFADLMSAKNAEKVENEARAALLLARVDSKGHASEFVAESDARADGMELSDYASAVVERIAGKVAAEIETLSDSDRPNAAARLIHRYLAPYFVRGKSLAFRSKEDGEVREGETDKERSARWDRVRRNMEHILAYHINKAVGIAVPPKPFTVLPEVPGEITHTRSWRDPYSVTAEFGKGEYKIATEKLSPSEAETRGVKPSPGSWNRMPDGGMVRSYLADKAGEEVTGAWNHLITELMGSRIAVRDEDGNFILKRVPPPNYSGKGRYLWDEGLMALIQRQWKVVAKKYQIAGHQETFERLLSAGFIGALQGIQTFDPAKVSAEHENSVTAVMQHVAQGVSNSVDEEASRIMGELRGDLERVLRDIKAHYGGSMSRLRILANTALVVQRTLAAAGIHRTPTKEDFLEHGQQMRATVKKYLPKNMPWETFIDRVFTHGTLSVSLNETHIAEDGEEVSSADKILGDAGVLNALQAGISPPGSGSPGRADTVIIKEVVGPEDLASLPVEERSAAGGEAFAHKLRVMAYSAQERDRQRVAKYGVAVAAPSVQPVHYDINYDPNKNMAVIKTTVLGAGVIHPEHIARLEMVAKLREALFRAMARGSGTKWRFSAEDAERLDMLYFPGVAFLPHQDYRTESHESRTIAKELAALELRRESWASDTARGVSNIRLQNRGVPVDESRALKRSYEASRKEARIALEADIEMLRKQYDATKTELHYPDVASFASATPGSSAYPAVPLKRDGSIDMQKIRHLTGHPGSFKTDPKYGVAYHMALRKALADKRYETATLTSGLNTEEHDNPLVRNRVKVAPIITPGAFEDGHANYAEPYIYDKVLGDVVPLNSIVTEEAFLEELSAVQKLATHIDAQGYFNAESPKGLAVFKELSRVREGFTPRMIRGMRTWEAPKTPGVHKPPPIRDLSHEAGKQRYTDWKTKTDLAAHVAVSRSRGQQAKRILRASSAEAASIAEGIARGSEIADGVNDPTTRYRASGHVLAMIEAGMKSKSGQQRLLDTGKSEIRQHIVIGNLLKTLGESEVPLPTRVYRQQYKDRSGKSQDRLVVEITSLKSGGASSSVHGQRGYKGPLYYTALYRVVEGAQPKLPSGEAKTIMEKLRHDVMVKRPETIAAPYIHEIQIGRPLKSMEEAFRVSESDPTVALAKQRPAEGVLLQPVETFPQGDDGTSRILLDAPPLRSYLLTEETVPDNSGEE